MDLKTLEEMADTLEELYDKACKANLETKIPEMRAFTFEFRPELKWLKGKMEQLIAERQITTQPPTTGREL